MSAAFMLRDVLAADRGDAARELVRTVLELGEEALGLGMRDLEIEADLYLITRTPEHPACDPVSRATARALLAGLTKTPSQASN